MGFQQAHPVLVHDKGYTLQVLRFTDLDDVKTEEPLDVLSKVDPHHPPLIFKFSIISDGSFGFDVKYRNFRRASYAKINSKLSVID